MIKNISLASLLNQPQETSSCPQSIRVSRNAVFHATRKVIRSRVVLNKEYGRKECIY
jgi:hypothetical protein